VNPLMSLVTAGIARRQWSYSFRCGAHSKTALTIEPCTFGVVPAVTVKGRRAGVSMSAMVLIVIADVLITDVFVQRTCLARIKV